MNDTVSVKGVEISNPEKVLFPGGGVTKRQLARYYADMAGTILPYLKDRPLVMERYPDGIGEDGFYQKESAEYFPDYVHSVTIKNRSEPGSTRYVLCDNARTLVYLAQLGCITPHAWLSRKDRPDVPDRLIFDLDPSYGDYATVVSTALLLKELLQDAGLTPFVMTTGSRGLHVLAPLQRKYAFDTVRKKAGEIAETAEKLRPDRLTTAARKEKRAGRLYLDIARNAFGQTAVVPYAVRARQNAPVAVPLDWEELASDPPGPQAYTLENIARRLGQKPDPWQGLQRYAAAL